MDQTTKEYLLRAGHHLFKSNGRWHIRRKPDTNPGSYNKQKFQ